MATQVELDAYFEAALELVEQAGKVSVANLTKIQISPYLLLI